MELTTLGNPIKESLEISGFASLPQLIDLQLCNDLQSQISSKLIKLRSIHNEINKDDYFATVNRWPADVLLSQETLENLILKTKSLLTKYLHIQLELFEADILYKSKDASQATPCHQDIAYVWQRPYAVSTWIALTDVTKEDSALQFLPKSHKDTISPAIDFWQPHYIDEMHRSLRWQSQAITCAVNRGDGLLFSSRIWHASLAQSRPQERFAIVLRWGNHQSLSTIVPMPKPSAFGMWNCGEITYQLLQKGLEQLIHQKLESLEDIINEWQALIEHQHLSFLEHDESKVARSLMQLRCLHQAYHAYRGGDGQGIVYANVYKYLLLSLEKYLRKVARK